MRYVYPVLLAGRRAAAGAGRRVGPTAASGFGARLSARGARVAPRQEPVSQPPSPESLHTEHAKRLSGANSPTNLTFQQGHRGPGLALRASLAATALPSHRGHTFCFVFLFGGKGVATANSFL